MRLTNNGIVHDVDVDPDMRLLWALRDVVGLTGTKYGWGRSRIHPPSTCNQDGFRHE